MSEEAQAEHISAVSEKMKQAFFEVADGETPGDALFAAIMALACFIYDITNRGAENTMAKNSAQLLVDAVGHMVKEDLN